MNQDVLVIIVLINVVATFSLWRKLTRQSDPRPQLNKKAARALWRSDPIVPKHNPPKTAGGNMSSVAHDVDRQFFADFKDFADVVNWWLGDKYTASRFRLQDLPAGDLSLGVDYSFGPMLGRAFAIFYNQTRIGGLEVSPASEYRAAHPEVHTRIKIDWARFLGFVELTQFLDAIALHVTSGNRENADYIDARQSIQSGLTNTLWNHYRVLEYDDPQIREDWGDLSLGFNGLASFYIIRRDAPARAR